jgi:hypothetical protein
VLVCFSYLHGESLVRCLFEDLENPDSNLATEIISADGVVLGKYFEKNRSQLKYADLPKKFVQALIATKTLFEHSGIDGRGTESHFQFWNKWWSEYIDTTISKTIVPWRRI